MLSRVCCMHGRFVRTLQFLEFLQRLRGVCNGRCAVTLAVVRVMSMVSIILCSKISSLTSVSDAHLVELDTKPSIVYRLCSIRFAIVMM